MNLVLFNRVRVIYPEPNIFRNFNGIRVDDTDLVGKI